MTYIITSRVPLSEYIFANMPKDVCMVYLKVRKQSLLFRIIKDLLFRLSFYKLLGDYIYDSEVVETLRQVRIDDTVVFYGVENKKAIFGLYGLLPFNCRKILYIQNPVSFWFNSKYKNQTINDLDVKAKSQKLFEQYKKIGVELTTFDKSDSQTYNLKYKGQVFVFPPRDSNSSQLEYDFYFCGRVKNRGEEINAIQTKLKDYHCLFLLVENGRNSKDRITYYENIENIKKSRCLIEINQKNQDGLTIRALEALFFNKKLLTNNLSIKKAPFYDSANIYIIGDESEHRTISDFLEYPSQLISDDIKKIYDINYWIKNL